MPAPASTGAQYSLSKAFFKTHDKQADNGGMGYKDLATLSVSNESCREEASISPQDANDGRWYVTTRERVLAIGQTALGTISGSVRRSGSIRKTISGT